MIYICLGLIEYIFLGILSNWLHLFLKSILPNCQVHFAIFFSFFGYVVYRWFLSLCQAHIANFTFPSHQLHIAKTLPNCQVHFKLWTAYMSFKLPKTINFLLSCPTPLKKLSTLNLLPQKNSNWLKKTSCFGWHSRTWWFHRVMIFSF